MNTQEGKVVVLTGGTSGIGAEAAKVLALQGMHIVLPVRNPSKGEQLKAEILAKRPDARIEIMECDLSSLQSVRDFADACNQKFSKIDVLINNAGVWETTRKESADGIELTFAVNHLAPFLMTNLLMDRLLATPGSRIITVSSNAHKYTKMNFADPDGKIRWNTTIAYSQSKLANVLFTHKLTQMLQGKGVAAFSMHPGVVATNLFSKFPGFLLAIFSLFMVSPQKGAETIVHLATADLKTLQNGAYYISKKPSRISSAGRNDNFANQLWELSKKYTGV
ncbi:MAG TPA: short-chain dehydrogenase [Bacteroidales bacterium]|nr:short-chain dehydrogenase [Bacteroidales bacterium]